MRGFRWHHHRVLCLALLLVSPSCSRAGFSLGEGEGGSPARDLRPADAARDGGPLADAADGLTSPLVRCGDWSSAGFSFVYVRELTELNDSAAQQAQPQLSYDGLTISFSRDGDMYEASRPMPSGPFGAPSPIAGLATSLFEPGGFISADRLSAYMMTDSPAGSGELDIWLYARATTAGAFVAVRELTELNTPGSDWDPFLTHDGGRIYGVRVVSGLLWSIWAAEANAGGGFSAPTLIEELDVMPRKGNPSLTYDQRVIVFNAFPSLGATPRLYFAVRADDGAAFSAPRLLPELEAQAATEPFISADGCELYFSAWDKEPRGLHLAEYRR